MSADDDEPAAPPSASLDELDYFVALQLDRDGDCLQAFASFKDVRRRQLEIAADYVPLREKLNEAEERHRAAMKWKQQDDEYRNAKKKDGKAKAQLDKTASTVTAMYPGLNALQSFVKTKGELFVARQAVADLDAKMNKAKEEEETLDTTILEAAKRAYRTLSLRLHPDRLPHSTEADTKRFQDLKEAYAVLSDTALRRKYLQMSNHEQFLRTYKPPADNQYERKSDQQRAQRAQQRAQYSTPAAAEEQRPMYRLAGGVPHRCSMPRVKSETLVDKTSGDMEFVIEWTCTDSVNLAVKYYDVQMVFHPLGSSRSTTMKVASVGQTVYKTHRLMPGLYDFIVTAVNEHAAGEPSPALRLYVADLEAERMEREREAEKNREARQASFQEECDRKLGAVETEMATSHRMSMTKIEELLEEVRQVVVSMKKHGKDLPPDRPNALLAKLTAARYHKMELAQWRGILQKGTKDIVSGVGSPGDAASELAQGALEWPAADQLSPAVRNLIFQTICGLAESVPPLKVVMDQEIVNMLSISEVMSLGTDDFEYPDATNTSEGERVYAPKWREMQPYDRAIEVLRVCKKRADLFGNWMNKIVGMLTKMEGERKRRETEWRNKITKERKAAEKAAEAATAKLLETETKSILFGSVDRESDKYEVAVSTFATGVEKVVAVEASSSSEPSSSRGLEQSNQRRSGVQQRETIANPNRPPAVSAEPKAEVKSAAQQPLPVQPPPQVQRTPPRKNYSLGKTSKTVEGQSPRPIAPPQAPVARPPSIPADVLPMPATTPQTLAALNEESIAMPRSPSKGTNGPAPESLAPAPPTRPQNPNRKVGNPAASKGQQGGQQTARPARSGIWKGSDNCRRLHPDGACTFGVRCWHASQHTFVPTSPVSTTPDTPAWSNDNSSAPVPEFLQGLKIVIEKHPVKTADAGKNVASMPSQPSISASIPVQAEQTDQVARNPPTMEAEQIAALWEIPTPSLNGVGSRPPPGLERHGAAFASTVSVPPVAAPPAPAPVAPETSSSGSGMFTNDELSLAEFFNSLGLGRFVQVFEENEFDMESLLLASDEDLRAMGLPMGPLVKLKNGLKKLREAEGAPSPVPSSVSMPAQVVTPQPQPATPVQDPQQNFYQQVSNHFAQHGISFSIPADHDAAGQVMLQSTPPIVKQQIEVPATFYCPITQEVMEHPVVAPDGFSYEESSIREWLKKHGTSPITGLHLARDAYGNKIKIVLTPNFSLRGQIQQFYSDYPPERYEYV